MKKTIEINSQDLFVLADNNYGDWYDKNNKDQTIINYRLHIEQALHDIIAQETERLLEDLKDDPDFVKEIEDRAV